MKLYYEDIADFFLILSLLAHSKESTMISDIASLQWKKRVIIVNEGSNVERLVDLFEQNNAAINERDIVWFIFKRDRVLTNYVGELSEELEKNTLEQYQLNRAGVILIGKDGGLKSRFEQVDLSIIFDKIDAMPMRISETRN